MSRTEALEARASRGSPDILSGGFASATSAVGQAVGVEAQVLLPVAVPAGLFVAAVPLVDGEFSTA